MDNAKKLLKEYGLYVIWLQSLISVLGSLYFSEIAHFAPCILCWYQRIFMYPIFFIVTLGIIKKHKNVPDYVLTLSLPGTLIAIYHNLLYNKLIPESVAPCTIGASCSAKYIEWFGFITIPFLSLLSFLLIDLIAILLRKYRA